MTAILELGTHFYFSNSQLDIAHIYGRKIFLKKKKNHLSLYILVVSRFQLKLL